jgi:hypothetical protein
VMDKNIVAILARDEAVPFGTVEPFYSPGHSFAHGQILLSARFIGRKGPLADTSKSPGLDISPGDRNRETGS